MGRWSTPSSTGFVPPCHWRVEPNQALQDSIRAELSRAFGKEVHPTFYVDASLLGGTLVKVGDRIFDGSLRRRMASLRRQLLTR